MVWTADEFLSDTRQEANVPDLDGDLASANVLRFADEVIDLTIAPRMRQARITHWLQTVDASLTSAQSDYRLPYRAQGGALYAVWYVDSNGNELPMTPVSLMEAWRYKTVADRAWRSGWGYAIDGEFLRVLPTPTSTTGTLRIKYFLRRSRLVLVASAGAITAFSVNSNTFTCTTVPASWTNALVFDQLRGKPGFDALALDQAATTVVTGASGTVRFTATVATTPSIDANFPDYLCKAGETCLVPLPVELHTALVTLTAARLQMSIGTPTAADLHARGLSELEQGISIIAPRVEQQSPRIQNRMSPLRQQARRWWPT